MYFVVDGAAEARPLSGRICSVLMGEETLTQTGNLGSAGRGRRVDTSCDQQAALCMDAGMRARVGLRLHKSRRGAYHCIALRGRDRRQPAVPPDGFVAPRFAAEMGWHAWRPFAAQHSSSSRRSKYPQMPRFSRVARRPALATHRPLSVTSSWLCRSATTLFAMHQLPA